MLPKSVVALLGLATAVQAFTSYNETIYGNHTVPMKPDTEPGFEVIVVYAPPPDGCPVQPTQCTHLENLPYPSASESLGEGYKDPASATWSHEGPIVTLTPAVHWDWDTKPATNIIPLPPNTGSQLYYGIDDPTQFGHYGFLTYYFNVPSVNLDHCDYIEVTYGPNELTITFSSPEAYDYARNTWNLEEELILVAFAEGCGDWAKGDRCYFEVIDLEFNDGDLIIVASGSSCDPNERISRGETEWGWWVPREGGEGYPVSSTQTLPEVVDTTTKTTPTKGPAASHYNSQSGASFSWNPKPTATDHNSHSSSGTHLSSPTSTSSPDSTDFGNQAPCKAPVDSKFGLPSACLGDFFDLDLDNELGWVSPKQDDVDFVKYMAPGTEVDGSDDGEDASAKRMAYKRAFNPLKALKKAAGFVVKPLKPIVKVLKKVTTISKSFNKQLSWNLPDPNNPSANKLKDPSTKQVDSPWGDAVLLKAFGDQKFDDKKALNGYMNIFCVGCGASGSARVAGKAAWTPFGGVQYGEVEVNTDGKFALKIGIDAQMNLKKEFKNKLLNIGLPGLEYGVVRIGPSISLGTRVKLEAAAKGKLLAGAEVGLQNAHAFIDFVNPSKSTQRGFGPAFQPIFEAEGELMLAATLGLPVGVNCGIKILSWTFDISLIDEPSITGVAQVAASVGLNSQNQFTSGFTTIEGCTGILAKIDFENRIWVDVFGFTEIPIHKMDKELYRRCISLPGRPSDPTKPNDPTNPTDPANPTDPSEPTDTAQPIDPAEPTDTAEPTNTADPTDPTEPTDPAQSEPTDAAEPDQPGNEDPKDGEPEAETGSDDLSRRLRSRQVDSLNMTFTPTAQSGGQTIDLTSKINGTDTVAYTIESVGNRYYNLTDGYEVALLIDTDATTMMAACSNGNIYAFDIDAGEVDYCPEIWASKEDVLVTDGGGRLMHYYNNTMSEIGVSRLRLESEADIPGTGVVVAFVPYFPDENSDNYFYLAIDPEDQVYYPIVCDYEDGAGSKMFLARDPDEGSALLESEDLQYTVTGGKIAQCYSIELVQGEYVESNDWISYGNSSDAKWEWELEGDWYE